MSTYLPPDIQAGLDAARKKALRDQARLRVQDGDKTYPVLEAWEGGFALDLTDSATVRGRVDLYDGARHLSQCLIIASEEDGDVMRFEYKRMTEASNEQPLDFERVANAPTALLGKLADPA